QNDVTLKMPAFEWVHVQLHQQKGMISLSPPTICNSAFDKTLAFLEAIVNADDETTVGEIRPFADDLDAVRFNRHKINRQLSRLDLASPVLEPEVIWLGRRR
ncbi:hypothetical protein MMU57_24385, partial [Escherichia coli]|nr:hypothetical protein [Escherichia coli]